MLGVRQLFYATRHLMRFQKELSLLFNRYFGIKQRYVATLQMKPGKAAQFLSCLDGVLGP